MSERILELLNTRKEQLSYVLDLQIKTIATLKENIARAEDLEVQDAELGYLASKYMAEEKSLTQIEISLYQAMMDVNTRKLTLVNAEIADYLAAHPQAVELDKKSHLSVVK